MALLDKTRLCFGFTLFAAIAAAQSDDSIWINQAISDAIASGRSSITLPARVINLDNNIIVPPGTKNFALIGAGIDRTVIKSRWKRQKFIDVGDQIVSHNNWGLTNKTNYNVETVPEGATTLRLLPGQAPLTPGDYVLWDENVIRNRSGAGDTYNRAEIVKVLVYNFSNRTVLLDQPVGRTFNVRPKLADYRTALSENITISGMTFDGLADDGQGSEALLSLNSVRNAVVRDVRFVNYSNGAMYVNVCKNTEISGVIIDRATQGGVGAGYGLTTTRSRFTWIHNVVANWGQAIKFHTGAMDSLVEDIVTTDGGNAIDSHGFDELRVTVRRATGNGGITLGNEAWAAGGSGHLVEDSDLGFLFIGPNATNVVVRRSRFAGALSLSDLDPNQADPNANPRGGTPGNLWFEDVEFTAAQNVVNDFVWYNVRRATFVRCKFTSTNPNWGSVIKLAGARGSLEFIECEFNAGANREAIEIATGAGNRLNLVIRNSVIRSEVGLDVGLWLRPTFQGSVMISNNRLISRGAPTNSTFLKNDGRARGVIRGNRVIRL